MSLPNCIPGMVERGEATPEQGARMQSLFDELLPEFRRQFGSQAAEAMASDATLKAMARDALKTKRQALLQMRAQANARAAQARYAKPGDPGWAPALIDRDGSAPYSNVEGRRKAIVRRAYAQNDALLAKHRRDLLGRVRDVDDLDDVGRVAFGEKVDNASANEIAQGWLGSAEMLRGRFNAAGGDIGKIDRWGLPQWHDAKKLRTAAGPNKSLDENYRVWRDAELPRLDRTRMIDRTTALPFSDERIELLLRDVYETKRTDGWSKRTPGGVGKGRMASRHGGERVLIYKDFDNWKASHDQFGKGSIFDAMIGHIETFSRDTAAMEILGPNPEATIKWLTDTIERDAALAPDDGAASDAARLASQKVERLWREYTGANREYGREWLAKTGSAVRAYETASKLGSAILSAVPGDLATQQVTARFNGLPFTNVMGNYLKLLDPANVDHQRLAIRLAAGAEGWAQANAATMRTFNAEMTGEIASRLSEGVLRVQGLSAWTDAGRWAYQMTLFGHIADQRAVAFDKLDDRFRDMLTRNGIGADGWDRLRATPVRREQGVDWIFPEDVADQALADRIIEIGATDVDRAVPVADLETTALFHEAGKPGTVIGEGVRNSLLFKSFGVAMLLTHGKRMMEMSSWKDRAQYGLNTFIGLTLAGALSIQLKEIAKGRDPRPMDDMAFWGAAMAQGGGFGMVGDLLDMAIEPRMSSFAKWIAGPVADTVQKTTEFGRAVYDRAVDAKTPAGNDKGNPGAAGRRLLESELPGGNLWFTKLAFQRLLLDRLSEATDPNYRKSWRVMEKRASDARTGYYWAPGSTSPERAPDFGNALPADQQGGSDR